MKDRRKKIDYRERFVFFIHGIEREITRTERFLAKAHKENNYKDCLEYKEYLAGLSWVSVYATHILETGEEL